MNTSAPIPKIFVLVLNYNGLATLNNCLSSVFQSDYKNFEVVVVDNNSKDGSLEKAKIQFSRAHFIKNSANVGFSQGNNVGIRFALEKFADAVFILNNDTLIDKGTISSLVSASKDNPDAGILSPLIMAADKQSVWFAGGEIIWDKMRTQHVVKATSDKPYSSQYISGCAMFVTKEVFKVIGLFDERYFLYYEDADFSLRANLANFKLLVIPSTKIIHLEQSTTNNDSKVYWLVLSGMLFFLTHSSFLQKIWLYFYIILRKIKNLYAILFAPTPLAKDIRKAYRDYRQMKQAK